MAVVADLLPGAVRVERPGQPLLAARYVKVGSCFSKRSCSVPEGMVCKPSRIRAPHGAAVALSAARGPALRLDSHPVPHHFRVQVLLLELRAPARTRTLDRSPPSPPHGLPTGSTTLSRGDSMNFFFFCYRDLAFWFM